MVGLIILSSCCGYVSISYPLGLGQPSWIEYYDVGTLAYVPNPAIRANHAWHEAELLAKEPVRQSNFGDGGVDQLALELLLEIEDRL